MGLKTGAPKSDPLARGSALPRLVSVGVLAIAVIAGVAIVGLTGEQPSESRGAMAVIRERGIWVAPPRLLSNAIANPTERDVGLVDPSTALPMIVTPYELVSHGAEYEGATVLVVGRVLKRTDLRNSEITEEYHLQGRSGTTAYIGEMGRIKGDSNIRGEVVWSPGRVAALGRTASRHGATRRTAYVLTPESNVMGSVSSQASIDGWRISPKLAKVVRAELKRPLSD